VFVRVKSGSPNCGPCLCFDACSPQPRP
jgi:hypothetical protein